MSLGEHGLCILNEFSGVLVLDTRRTATLGHLRGDPREHKPVLPLVSRGEWVGLKVCLNLDSQQTGRSLTPQKKTGAFEIDACPWTQLETFTGQIEPESSMDHADGQRSYTSFLIYLWSGKTWSAVPSSSYPEWFKLLRAEALGRQE